MERTYMRTHVTGPPALHPWDTWQGPLAPTPHRACGRGAMCMHTLVTRRQRVCRWPHARGVSRSTFWLVFIAQVSRILAFGSLFRGLFNRTVCPDDTDARCAQWAADGECNSNPGFMMQSCARSCGKCEGGSTVPRMPARRALRGCHDELEYNCSSRAVRGECESDKGEMLWRCPAACRVCPYLSLVREALGCDDTSANCNEWARHGECRAKCAASEPDSPLVWRASLRA